MKTPARRAVLGALTAWVCGWAVRRDARAQQSRDSRLVPPRPVHKEKPVYTRAARDARIEGEVVLAAVVGTDGSVETATVVTSLDATHGLDDAAIAAALKWRFEPGTIDGKPVRVRVTIALEFTL